MKLSHALEGFWLSKRLDFSAATVRNYEGVFRQFLAHMGNAELTHAVAALTVVKDNLELALSEIDS